VSGWVERTTIVCLRRIRVVSKLARPFLATGILGGFTTFSTAAVDSQQLATSGHLFLGAVNISRHRRRRPGRRPPTRRVADLREIGLKRRSRLWWRSALLWAPAALSD
jgi:hypothetical protein